MKLVKFIKYYSRGKSLSPKQVKREEERLRKVMMDFEKVWGDDLDWLDLIDELSEDKSDNLKSI